MFSRQLDQLARDRHDERAAQAARTHVAKTIDSCRAPGTSGIRSQTGWAIVAIGLRIAESGNR